MEDDDLEEDISSDNIKVYKPPIKFFSPNSFELLRKEYQIILKNNFEKFLIAK